MRTDAGSVLTIARSEFISGGQRSGKSKRAEMLAASWLDRHPDNRSVLIATATAWDEEMTSRIDRHREDRRQRVPRMETIEEPRHIARALATQSAQTLVVVDCLTLWLTNCSMPVDPLKTFQFDLNSEISALENAIRSREGPTVLVSNEIGLGVIPMGAHVRRFVDDLGAVNQAIARLCERATLMVSGLPLFLKGSESL